jgi:FKBP-type peptidyl-prolyl cis-trans isomerase
MSEKVGRHKGAVETLMHEQKELSRLLQIVQGQLERHMNALDEAGVDTEKFVEQLQQEQEQGKPEQPNADKQKSQNRRQQEQEARRDQNKRSPSAERSGDEAGSSSSEDVDNFLEGEDDENEDFAPY